MKTGPNMTQMGVWRRATDEDGLPTGAYAHLRDVWARWTQSRGALTAASGQKEDPIDLIATVNDSIFNRTISNADRARINDIPYTIQSVGLPERKSGTIQLMLRREINS